jgi:hypothetical protein
MDNCNANAMAKKSLMNTLENLERQASILADLANFSNKVVDKLNNPIPQPEPQCDCDGVKGNPTEPILDLIDLFNKVAEKINRATNEIGNNIENINSFIG